MTASSTTSVGLPFDRSFGERLEGLLQAVLQLEASVTTSNGRTLAVTLRHARGLCGPTALRPMVSSRVGLSVDGAVWELYEQARAWVPESAWSAPEEALEAIESFVRRELREVVEAVAAEIARDVEPARDDLLGDDVPLTVEQRDQLFGIWDRLDAFEHGWRPSAATVQPSMAADTTIAVPNFELLTRFATTPALVVPEGRGLVVDAYHVARGFVHRLVAEAGVPGLGPDSRYVAGWASALESCDVVVTDHPGWPSAAPRRVVVWKPPVDPQDDGDHSASAFLGESAPGGVVWFAGSESEAIEAILDRSIPLPDHFAQVPVVGWLLAGLREGRWSDARLRPPPLVELGGRVAFMHVLRSTLPPDQKVAAVHDLVAHGAVVDQSPKRRFVDESGTLIEPPLVEAARHAGDEVFEALLVHSRDADLRCAIHERLVQDPAASQLARSGHWV